MAGASFHLFDAGISELPPGPELQLVEEQLVRRTGAAALSGKCMVDISPQKDMFSVPENFVSAGRQQIPLAGCADLAPGDLFGDSFAPLVHVAIGDLDRVADPPHTDSSPSAVYAVPDEESPDPKCDSPLGLLDRLNEEQRKRFVRV